MASTKILQKHISTEVEIHGVITRIRPIPERARIEITMKPHKTIASRVQFRDINLASQKTGGVSKSYGHRVGETITFVMWTSFGGFPEMRQRFYYSEGNKEKYSRCIFTFTNTFGFHEKNNRHEQIVGGPC